MTLLMIFAVTILLALTAHVAYNLAQLVAFIRAQGLTSIETKARARLLLLVFNSFVLGSMFFAFIWVLPTLGRSGG